MGFHTNLVQEWVSYHEGACTLCRCSRSSCYPVSLLRSACRLTEKSADAITSSGFALTGIWGEGRYQFSVSDGVPVGEHYDYIFITSKSQDTETICRQYAAIIRYTETISLQNGIGNEEIISRRPTG